MKMKEKIISFFFREREIRTIWKVEKDGRFGFLAGAAHFFPYRFTNSLRGYIRQVRVVCFEGPLDESSMGQVVQQGTEKGGARTIYEALDPPTIEKIKALTGDLFRPSDPFPLIFPFPSKPQDPLSAYFESLRPWMAFFQIWSNFLKQRGWKYSVDLEALKIARQLRREIVFLETIEEQIAGLEGIPVDRIVRFFQKIDQWEEWARDHSRLYLQGDMEAMLAMSQEFPSRCPSIVEHRDPVMFDRMKGYFEKGQVMALVGTTHIPGIQRRFQAEGYRITQVSREEE
jgi:hypothetical protein